MRQENQKKAIVSIELDVNDVFSNKMLHDIVLRAVQGFLSEDIELVNYQVIQPLEDLSYVRKQPNAA